MALNLYPKNDFAVLLTLNTVDPTTGAKTPVTVGPVSAFLATTPEPTVAEADPSLKVTCTSQGSGKWVAFFDASLLNDVTLLDGLFLATGFAYLIVQKDNEIRGYIQIPYVRERAVVLQ